MRKTGQAIDPCQLLNELYLLFNLYAESIRKPNTFNLCIHNAKLQLYLYH